MADYGSRACRLRIPRVSLNRTVAMQSLTAGWILLSILQNVPECAPSKSVTRYCYRVSSPTCRLGCLEVNCEVQSAEGSNQVTMYD